MPAQHRGDLAAARAGIAALAVVVIARLLFHALFVPVFEGPDEPQHLSRASDFADAPFSEAFQGRGMSPLVVGAVLTRPCGPDLHRSFGCPPFGEEPAAFNLVRPRDAAPFPETVPNYENHQPPLYYFLSGLLLRVLQGLGLAGPRDVDARLLSLRLLSVILVAAALWGPLRALARRRTAALAAGFLLLLSLPGAAEALARCSNDAMLFLWTAFALLLTERRAKTVWVAALLGVGPMIKLTALPVALVVALALWARGRKTTALAASAAALLVVPIQLLRGWRWGGTYELNRPGRGLEEPISETLVGLVRSAYTFLKTTVWVGGWSFFPAPREILLLCAALALSWLVLAKKRAAALGVSPHLAGAAATAIGVLFFSVANRRYYGDWGGLGGWYLWGWAPWLAVAATDLLTIDRRKTVFLLTATAILSLAVNAAYYRIAWGLYG